MNAKLVLFIVIIGSLSVLNSCKRDPDPVIPTDSSYSIPTTYSFSNVDISGQQSRMAMFTEMVNLMLTGNTIGTPVDAATLKNMYRNTNNPFTDVNLNASTKNLISKTFYLDTNLFLAYMDSLELCSASLVSGSNGVAGVVTSSTNNTKKYLLNERGFEFKQILEKGIMGAVFYYQVMDHYLSDNQIGAAVDNTNVITGQGTAMEHHWDEAFGYFGAPNDFPANILGAEYWALASTEINGVLGVATDIMDAFRSGRAAISNNDMTTKFEKRDLIRTKWELIIAGMFIHEINEALIDFSDDALRNHELSEAIGFLRALKYSPVKIITNSEITQIENMIGSNLYNVTIGGLNNAKDALSTIYNLDAVKNNL